MITISRAGRGDLPSILSLQRLAYQSEALLLDNPAIPPLTQTLQDVQREYETGIFLKAVDENGAIVGSVRAASRDGTLHIGKLIVHPDCQGQGIGTRLLLEIEAESPHARYELFTSSRSLRNIRLYERNGYVVYCEEDAADGIRFVFLHKQP